MDAQPDRLPEYAKLGEGLTKEDLWEAVRKSGYPFQAAVTDLLGRGIKSHELESTIQEEWAYVDSDAEAVRSIDILVESRLTPAQREENSARVTPTLSLLVECKQSDLPYLFFVRENAPASHYTFPEIAGLPSSDMEFFWEKDGQLRGGSYSMSVHDTFAFWDEDFFDAPTLFAISMSKAVRKGRQLSLTGEEAYRSLTLPLMKAAGHLKKICSPAAEQRYYNCRLIVCVAVLRAPMWSVLRLNDEDRLMATPWVRACRLEPQESEGSWGDVESYVRYYDVVHELFLESYLDRLLSAAISVGSRISSKADIVAEGRAISRGGSERVCDDMEPLPGPVAQSEAEREPKLRVTRRMAELEVRVNDE